MEGCIWLGLLNGKAIAMSACRLIVAMLEHLKHSMKSSWDGLKD